MRQNQSLAATGHAVKIQGATRRATDVCLPYSLLEGLGKYKNESGGLTLGLGVEMVVELIKGIKAGRR